MELPQEFLARMKNMLGGEYEDFLRTYEEPRRFGLRVNTLKISVEEFVKLAPFHLRRIPWTDNGFYYEKEDDPARHPFYYAGLYYLQEPSAMLPAQILPASPGERVLDLCAAPGGKATALAAKLQGEGLLVANEISASRAKALLKNLEVFGVTNSFVTNTTANRLAEQFPDFFDKILVDAPCSGEGMFRKDIANAKAWSLDKVQSCAKIQREITKYAADMLRPGGLLLYSTCTFAPEEDEGTVAYLLNQCPELELMEISGCGGFQKGSAEYLRMIAGTDNTAASKEQNTGNETLHVLCREGILDDGAAEGIGIALQEELSKCVRLFSHRCDGEGHFLALFRKKDAGEGSEDIRECGRDVQECGKDVRERGKDVWENREKRKYVGSRHDIRQDMGVAYGRTVTGGRKKGAERKGQEKRKGEESSREERATLLEFLKEVSAEWDPRRFEVRSGQAYYVPETAAASVLGAGLPFLRNGLYLGELRRGRFEPSQSLAMALKPEEYASVVDFAQDDARVRRYLCGETVEVDDLAPRRSSGWQLVCVCGYPLGWGRLVNGTLKNKYHPGWRMQN